MIWGNGSGASRIIEGNVSGATYWETLEENLFSSAKKENLGRRWMLQQDTDPKHTAKLIREGLAWSSQSPDLSPVENLWRILKLQAHQWEPYNLRELKTICQEKWAKIEPQSSKSLINCYHRCLDTVTGNNSFETKY